MTLILSIRPPKVLLIGFVLLALSVCLAPAQSMPEPKHEQLLNGLRIWLWPHPADSNVLIKLRIHSGAAFDLAGKAGQMALLGDVLFPDSATHEYFTDEMGGRLEVETNYDSITITMQGRANEFERIVEILRTALVSTPVTVENVARVREARVKLLTAQAKKPEDVANRAIAARLFGDFPYGRPYNGTAETVAHIDRADLLLAKERFLNPDNSTLTIIGSVEQHRAMRALRQLLGIWRKSERIVPATFRQPAAPGSGMLVVNAPGSEMTEVRVATRGLSRSDRDYPAASLLAVIARERWRNMIPQPGSQPFVKSQAYGLAGMFVLGASVNRTVAARTLETAQSIMRSLSDTLVSRGELETARSEAILAVTRDLSQPERAAEAWLDLDTYSLQPLATQRAALESVSATDLLRVAARLFKDNAAASVVVGNADYLRVELERLGKVEVLGQSDTKVEVPKAKSATSKATTATKP